MLHGWVHVKKVVWALSFCAFGARNTTIAGISNQCNELKILFSYFCIVRRPTGSIVYIGVKFVNKFAALALACVIFSIIAVYVGIFHNYHGNDKLQWVSTIVSQISLSFGQPNTLSFSLSASFTHNSMCVLGKRLLKDIALDQCNKSITNGTLFHSFCNATGHCEPYYRGNWQNTQCMCQCMLKNRIFFRAQRVDCNRHQRTGERSFLR